MADEAPKSDNLVIKAVAAVFITVLAPVLVAAGLKWTEKAFEAPKSDSAKPAAASDATASPTASPSSSTDSTQTKSPDSSAGASTSATPAEPALPKKSNAPAVRLFNGKDFVGFYTYLGPPDDGKKPYGRDNDPEKPLLAHTYVVCMREEPNPVPHRDYVARIVAGAKSWNLPADYLQALERIEVGF